MTLILGLNLTDSVFLAADTRVTQMQGKEIVGTHDNLMKIWGNQKGIWCAVAGDAGLAKYLLNELRDQSFSNKGIEAVRENIEELTYEKADEYWQTKRVSSHATLMFAGNSQRRRARIKKRLLKNLVDAHLGNDEASNEKSGQKFLIYSQVADKEYEEYKTNLNATDLFAVQVSERGVSITDTEPGQHLAFGSPGLVKEDIELKEVARIEFGDTNNTAMLMTSYINMMKDKRGLKGVGSTVVPVHIQPDGTSILVTGGTHRITIGRDGKPTVETLSSLTADPKTGNIYRLEGKNKIALIPIGRYEINEGDSQFMHVM